MEVLKEELKNQAFRKQVEQKEESTFRNVFTVTNGKKNPRVILYIWTILKFYTSVQVRV